MVHHSSQLEYKEDEKVSMVHRLCVCVCVTQCGLLLL